MCVCVRVHVPGLAAELGVLKEVAAEGGGAPVRPALCVSVSVYVCVCLCE